MKKYTPFLLVLVTIFVLIGVEACGPTQAIQMSNPIALDPKNDPRNPIAVYKNEVTTTFKKAFKPIFDNAKGNTTQDKFRNALADFEKLGLQGTLFRPQTVTGYYYNDPTPVLLSDPYWHVVNMPTPKSERLILKEGKTRYLDNKYWGKKVTMTVQPNVASLTKYLFKKSSFGGIMFEKDKISPQSETDFNIDNLDFDVDVTVVGVVNGAGDAGSGQAMPRYHSFRNLFLAPKLPYVKERFALLYSGGNIEAEARARFWNDLKFMYKTLVNKRQINPENIIVIYKDGFQEAHDTLYKTEIPVHFRAATTAIDSAIAQLRVKMGTGTVPTAELFVYMTNHGGQMADSYSRDELGDGTDETIFLYDLVDDQLAAEADDTWRNRLQNLPYKRLIAVIEPCFGGGLLRDLGTMNATAAKEHIIITATTEDKVSYGERPVGFDIFSYFFTSALAGKYPDGRAVKGVSTTPFSLFKAFTFARDSAYYHSGDRQRSLLDDNRDGLYERNPTAPKRDSSLANKF